MRNPRKDPQPGDLLVKGTVDKYVSRLVTKREGSDVHYFATGNGKGVRTHHASCWITTWMQWARDAQIERRGNDAG